MTLWTGILTCATCGAEINRAEHVPDEKRGWVALTSPFAGGCPKDQSHSSMSDCNLNTELTWWEEGVEPIPEKPAPSGKCKHGWRGHAIDAPIFTPCPACGSRSIFIGTGGHLTCGNLSCPNPGLLSEMGRRRHECLSERDVALSEKCEPQS